MTAAPKPKACTTSADSGPRHPAPVSPAMKTRRPGHHVSTAWATAFLKKLELRLKDFSRVNNVHRKNLSGFGLIPAEATSETIEPRIIGKEKSGGDTEKAARKPRPPN